MCLAVVLYLGQLLFSSTFASVFLCNHIQEAHEKIIRSYVEIGDLKKDINVRSGMPILALKEISSLRNQRFSRSCRSMTVNVYAKRDVDQVVISTVMEVIHFSQAKYMPASCIIYFHKTLYLGSRGRRRGRQRVRGRRSK